MQTEESTLPPRIRVPIADIKVVNRQRTDLGDITSLAESIERFGLLQPIVINQDNMLIAGERRLRAHEHLKLTEIDVNFFETLDDAQLHILEVEENVERKSMTWRERTLAVEHIHKLQVAAGFAAGERWTMRETGRLLKKSLGRVQQSLMIAERLRKDPDFFKDCSNFTEALRALMQEAEDRAMKKLGQTATPPASPTKGMSVEELLGKPLSKKKTSSKKAGEVIEYDEGGSRSSYNRSGAAVVGVNVNHEDDLGMFGEADAQPAPKHVVDLTNSLIHGDALQVLRRMPSASVDHVISDPPYAIDMAMLQQSSNVMDVSRTADEHDEETNREFLSEIIPHLYRVIKPNGFCVLCCDITMFEALKAWMKNEGFNVQSWPLIWFKTHTCKNEAPAKNFTKNYELAILARKGNAVLQDLRSSSVWQGSADGIRKEFDHPFAKPSGWWEWLIKAVAMPGQTILDPCAGSGSCPHTCVMNGMRPLAIEVAETHYNHLTENVKQAYRLLLKGEVEFV